MNAIRSAVLVTVAAARSPRTIKLVLTVTKTVTQAVATATVIVVIEETVRRGIFAVADFLRNRKARKQAKADGQSRYSKSKTRSWLPKRSSVPRLVVDALKASAAAFGVVVLAPVWCVVRPVCWGTQYLLGLPVRLAVRYYGSGLWHQVRLGVASVFLVLSWPFNRLDRLVTGALWVCLGGIQTWSKRHGVRSFTSYHNAPVDKDAQERVVTFDSGPDFEFDPLHSDYLGDAVNDLDNPVVRESMREYFAAHSDLPTRLSQDEGDGASHQDDNVIQFPTVIPADEDDEDDGLTDMFETVNVDLNERTISANPRLEGRRVYESLVAIDPALPQSFRRELRTQLEGLEGITSRQIEQFFAGFNRAKKGSRI